MEFWIARDKNGGLFLYAEKPYRDALVWLSEHMECCEINKALFPEINWEDEPIKVKLIKD